MKRFLSWRRNRAALRRIARRLAANRRGVAAVEFAFVLPVMMFIYFGIVEVGQGVMIERKVTSLTRAVGDLTAQTRSATISTAEMTGIFDAADTVMMPYTSVKPTMTVTSVVVDNAGAAKVCWSNKYSNGAFATGLSRGSAVALPNGVKVAGSSVIMATASYDFLPVIGYIITGTIAIDAGPFYMRPRSGKIGGSQSIEQIERTGVAMCP